MITTHHKSGEGATFFCSAIILVFLRDPEFINQLVERFLCQFTKVSDKESSITLSMYLGVKWEDSRIRNMNQTVEDLQVMMMMMMKMLMMAMVMIRMMMLMMTKILMMAMMIIRKMIVIMVIMVMM